MEQQDRQPEPLHDVISHRGTTITIREPYQLRRALEQQVAFTLLQLDQDELPSPCTEAVVHYDNDNEQQAINIGSYILYRPSEGSSYEDKIDEHIELQNQIKGDFEEQNIATVRLPHNVSTFYTYVDKNYSICVSYNEGPTKNGLSMTLVHNSNLPSNVWPHEEDDTDNPAPTETYDAIRTFLHQWSIAVDSLAEFHGTPKSLQLVVNKIAEHPTTPQLEAARISYPDAEEAPRISLNTLGGLTYPKERLREIALIHKNKITAEMYGVQAGHFLLHGPAGTGKTSLAEAFAHELDASFHSILSTDVMIKWIGESGSKLAGIFKAAKDQAQSSNRKVVLFFDEFDSIAQKGRTSSSEHTQVKNVLKQELTDLRNNHPNVIVAAATNLDIGDFDEAIVRAGRLEPIYVSTPNDTERSDIWASVISRSIAQLDNDRLPIQSTRRAHRLHFSPYAEDLSINDLTTASTGMTGADIEIILERARTRRFVEAIATGEKHPVTTDDILESIRTYQKP